MSCGCKQKQEPQVIQQPPIEPSNISVELINVDQPTGETPTQTETPTKNS